MQEGPTGPAEAGLRTRRARLSGSSDSRLILEPLVFVTLAILYVWIVRPTRNDWLKGPVLAVIVLIPFASLILRRDPPRDLGLRIDNLLASAREVGILTGIGAAVVVGLGWSLGAGTRLSVGVIDDFLLYPLWGVAQQFAMQSFTYRRLRAGMGGVVVPAVLTALLFAAVHFPNLALAATTLVGGFAWCLLFQRHPNLFTLGISHGWLAVLLRYSWPAEWLHNLRIGPGYWTWTP